MDYSKEAERVFGGATDEELLERLDIGAIVIKLEVDEDWKIVKELCQRHEKLCIEALLKTPASETERIRDLQMSVNKWRKIFGELKTAKEMCKLAVVAADNRGLVERKKK